MNKKWDSLILLALSVFLLSYILVVLVIKYTYVYSYYLPGGLNNSEHIQNSLVHYPYIIVYGLMSLVYSFSFYKLQLDKKRERKIVSKWISLFFILFFSGLVLFAINKYHWGIWAHSPLWERWFNILLDYAILFVPFEKIKPVLIWMFSAGIITYLTIRFSSKDKD